MVGFRNLGRMCEIRTVSLNTNGFPMVKETFQSNLFVSKIYLLITEKSTQLLGNISLQCMFLQEHLLLLLLLLTAILLSHGGSGYFTCIQI
jgi:hypothetical protein